MKNDEVFERPTASHTFIPTAAGEYADVAGDSLPRLDSVGGVAPLDDGDDAFE